MSGMIYKAFDYRDEMSAYNDYQLTVLIMLISLISIWRQKENLVLSLMEFPWAYVKTINAQEYIRLVTSDNGGGGRW